MLYRSARHAANERALRTLRHAHCMRRYRRTRERMRRGGVRSDSRVRCTLVECSVRGSSVGVLSRWSDNQSFHTGDLWDI